MRYIVFDLDDTLLDRNKEISAYTLAVLGRLQAMGHRIVINTARSLSYSREPFDILSPDYAVLSGGALIVDREKRPIFRAGLDHATTLSVIRELLALTDNFSVQTETTLYSSGDYSGQDARKFNFREETFPFCAQKIVAAIPENAPAAALAEKFGLTYTTYLDGPFRRYSPPDTTKATGNRHLAALTGGRVEDIIAFGDDLGDVEMLRQAGVGVLMKNARKELWPLCPRISRFSCDEDGVARFLAEYFRLEM